MADDRCPWPGCEKLLEGLGRFCHACGRYVSDYRPDAQEGDPVPAPRKDDDRDEKAIQGGIKSVLAMRGFGVWDTSQPFAAKITPGVPDLFVVGHGLTFWVEVKSATGKVREEQLWFHKQVTKNGGHVVIARHEEDVVKWVDGMLRKRGGVGG